MLEVEKGVLHFEGAVEGTGRWAQGNLEAKKGEKLPGRISPAGIFTSVQWNWPPEFQESF